jgi:hypothetical protein
MMFVARGNRLYMVDGDNATLIYCYNYLNLNGLCRPISRSAYDCGELSRAVAALAGCRNGSLQVFSFKAEPELMELLDRIAEEKGLTRGELLRKMIRQFLLQELLKRKGNSTVYEGRGIIIY